MKKTLAFLTASVMALASLPILSVTAEEQFAPGDVDMDGYITGHDAALVSRHLMHGDNNLSAEQLKLADINGDGEVTQADADAIFEKQEYILGDIDLNGVVKMHDAFDAMQFYAYAAAGNPMCESVSQLQKNLCDMSGLQNTEVTLDNIFLILGVYSTGAAGWYKEKVQEYGYGVYMWTDDTNYYFYDLNDFREIVTSKYGYPPVGVSESNQ